MSKIHRLLIGAAVIAASLAPAGSAFALSGMNHNELLLLDWSSPLRWTGVD